MFDFDVVTGPGDRAKPARPEARRRQMPAPGAAVPPAAMAGDPKDSGVGDTTDPPPFE